MDESGGKSYSRARGRIAEVLADARASLTEPSRPFTPASLDQRTSLSNINSLDKHGRIAMSRTSVGRRTTSKKSTNNAYGQSGGEYDMYDSERHGEVKDVKIASTFSEMSPKDLVTALNAPKTSAANNISASINYINSILPTNDDSCKNSHQDAYNKSNQSSNSSQRQHLICSDEFCTNAKSAVDTICKFLKNDRAKDPEDMRGVVSLIQKIFQFFSTYTKTKNQNQIENENKNENENEIIDDGVKENQNERNRKLRSRLILQLCTAVMSKKDFLFGNGESSLIFKMKYLIPKMILKTVKNLFQHLKSVNEINTVRSSSISEKTCQTKGQNHSDSNGQSKYHSNVSNNNNIEDKNDDDNSCHNFDKKNKNISLPKKTTSSNYVEENNLDLLLEFQSLMSVMIPDFGLILLNKIDQISVSNNAVLSHHNNESNSNNIKYNSSKSNRYNNRSGNNVNKIDDNENKDDDDDTSNDSDDMSDNNEKNDDKHRDGNGNESQNNFRKEERMFFMLLEASIFSAGIIRHHSTDDSVRKLINKFNLIEIVSEELRAIGSFTVICQKRLISNTEKVKNEIISKFVGDKANELCLKIIHKLSEIVVQLVVIIRNYSIDSDGKSQLINTKIVGLLCSLLKPFKHYPELILNCVRVTAKLSLQDNFRAQINSKTAQIKCLIDVLVQEGTICLDVMNGTSEVKSINPYNHQYGNTSNNDNRENHHNNGNNNINVTDSTSWPYWYTWPLISRIAFTLGNLTTSNSLNRIKIGLDCKSLDSIFCLLQACTGFLTAVYSAKNTAHLSDFNESKEVHSNDNEEFNDSDSDSDEGDADPESNDNDSKGTMELELADSTIKLLRLLANLCIEEGVGEKIVENPDIIEMLTDLIACTSSTYTQTEKGEVTENKKGSKDKGKYVEGNNHSNCNNSNSSSNSNSNSHSHSHSVVLGLGEEIGEELLLNAIAVCTNITFYACKDDNNNPKESKLTKQQNNAAKSNNNKTNLKKEKQSVILSKLLSHCLFHENDEIVLESARALGNLTRLRAVTRSLILTRCDETLLLLLAHTNSNIVTAASGALVNLTGDPDWRVTYTVQTSPKDSIGTMKSNPFTHLVSILRRTSLKNIPLSVLVCQILHNLLFVMENEEASDEKEYSEEKNNDKYSTKFYHFNHKIPSLLSKTLNELIDCADDMVEALSSITMKQINRNENGNECVKENSYDNVNHIFLIPQLTNANEDVKKYTDFTIIGKKLLAKLKLSYH